MAPPQMEEAQICCRSVRRRAFREQLEEVQATLAGRKISLHHLQTEHASLRAIARLLAGAE